MAWNNCVIDLHPNGSEWSNKVNQMHPYFLCLGEKSCFTHMVNISLLANSSTSFYANGKECYDFIVTETQYAVVVRVRQH